MALPPVHGLGLCGGVGALELAVHLALGSRHRTVGYVERDAYAAAVLVARMEDQTLAPAPIWDDLSTFDGHPWRGAVDLVTAGFPCQPFSTAGKKLGLDDHRWLWPLVERCVRDVRPSVVFLENVPDLTLARGGLGHVLGGLAEMGFDAQWCVLPASSVGAPHRRRRVYLLAHNDRAGRLLLGGKPGDHRDPWDHAHRRSSTELVHSDGAGREGDVRRPYQGRPGPGDRRGALANSDGGRRLALLGDDDARQPNPVGCRSARRIFPPGPDDLNQWREVLSSEPSLEPSVLRDADGLAGGLDGHPLAHRLDRVRCVGNGVVSLAAAAAFLHLAERAGLT